MSILVLGGARSGKSRYAESWASKSTDVVYIATAQAVDDEMKARIEKHKSDRPKQWQTIEAPVQLGLAINEVESNSTIILIDCLSFWVNNCLYASEQIWHEQRESFFRVLSRTSNSIVMVSNEVGMGITPMGAETRLFVDELGRLHQELARKVNSVVLMTAGIPLALKGNLPD